MRGITGRVAPALVPALVLVLPVMLAAPVVEAQVLDEDLVFEDGVAVIDLGGASAVLFGVGPERAIDYEATLTGWLYLSVMAGAGLDPYLRVEDLDGEVLGEDDDSGGGKDAFLKVEVGEGEGFVFHVALKGEAGGEIRFKLYEAAETEETLAAAGAGEEALKKAAGLRGAGRLEEARRVLAEAAEKLLETPGAQRSPAIHEALWRLGFRARDLGALRVAKQA